MDGHQIQPGGYAPHIQLVDGFYSGNAAQLGAQFFYRDIGGNGIHQNAHRVAEDPHGGNEHDD